MSFTSAADGNAWPPPEQYGQQGPPPAPSNRGRRLVVAIVAAVAVVLAVVLTVVFVNGDDGPQGAASPEAAVTALADAVTKQDPAGLVATMNPGEVRSLGAVLSTVRGKAAKDGLVAKNGPLLSWLHVSLDDLKLRVDSKPRDDFAFVAVSGGSAGVRIDRSRAPSALNLRGGANGGSVDIADALDDAELGFTPVIATIRSGGGWFVSPTTTALENVRRALDLPEPSWTNPVRLSGGAGSADDAVKQFVDAANRRDPVALLGTVDPQELPAGKYYYESFAARIARGIDRLDDYSITDLATSSTPLSDGYSQVTVNSVTLSVDGDTARYSGRCLTQDGRDPACLSSRVSKLSGIRDVTLVAKEHDGKWYVSPIATALSYAQQYLRDGSPNAIYLAVLGRRNLTLLASTQTIGLGGSQRVKLNDAGFAVVRINGSPGKCVVDDAEFSDESNDSYVYIREGDGCSNESDNADYYYGTQMPASGHLTAVVEGEATGTPYEVTVRISGR